MRAFCCAASFSLESTFDPIQPMLGKIWYLGRFQMSLLWEMEVPGSCSIPMAVANHRSFILDSRVMGRNLGFGDSYARGQE